MKKAASAQRAANASSTDVSAAAASIAAAEAAAEKLRAKEAGYKEKMGALELKVLRLEKDLAVLQANHELAISDAFRKGGEEAKRKVTQIILESKEEYKKGLADGAALATGKPYHLQHNSRRSASASDSYGGSSTHGRRISFNRHPGSESE